ncbi:MAG: XRE family transcriptional regulator [Leptospirales bacterium]
MPGTLPEESIKKAQENATDLIFQIKLSELREKQGLKQTDMKEYSQPGLSRMENRKDMKLSTLIKYIHNLGMELEIKARPKKKASKSFVLYKG